MLRPRFLIALASVGTFVASAAYAGWYTFSADPNLLPSYYQYWDQSANYTAFRALNPTMQKATLFNHATSQVVYEDHFKHQLRRMALAAKEDGVGGASITSYMTALLQDHYPTCRANLAAAYPGLTEEQYKALMIQCLVNGFYGYGGDNGYATQVGPYRTRSQELYDLLQLDTGNCATMAELVRLLGRAMGLDIRNVNVETDFTSYNGHYIYSVHAFNLLRDSSGQHTTIDAQTNIALGVRRLVLSRMANGHDLAVGGVGDGMFVSEYGIDRFQTLRNRGQTYGFFSAFVDEDVRYPAVYRRADASVINFYYNYMLEAYPRQGNTRWTVINRYQAP
jgi:hypothetical protein